MAVAAKQHWRAPKTSSMLTEWFRGNHRPMAAKVTPEKVIPILTKV
jgi:hypothetical protein